MLLAPRGSDSRMLFLRILIPRIVASSPWRTTARVPNYADAESRLLDVACRVGICRYVGVSQIIINVIG